ncbi:hypothetical protein E2C01_000849 [Portunus trituberculatus]|uniref:Uncharacterized protein n=1 Tax=Portunus trituberculatus TaxID=210409 RepID=A0A5B7CG83_PORTR|nr:hypothetical protein [Portunus trituberculatus]
MLSHYIMMLAQVLFNSAFYIMYTQYLAVTSIFNTIILPGAYSVCGENGPLPRLIATRIHTHARTHMPGAFIPLLIEHPNGLLVQARVKTPLVNYIHIDKVCEAQLQTKINTNCSTDAFGLGDRTSDSVT